MNARGPNMRGAHMRGLARQKPAPKSGKQWLVSFGDLVSLMLTFFVMLFAMSSVKEPSWNDLVNALSQRLNPSRGTDVEISLVDRTVETQPAPDASDLDYLHALLSQKIRRNGVLQRALLLRRDDRLIISLPVDLVFTASGRLTDAGRRASGLLAETLRFIPNRVEIVGHAEGDAMDDSGYGAAWEDAIGDALALSGVLRAAGLTRPLVVLGRVGAPPLSAPGGGTRTTGPRIDVIVGETIAQGGDGAP